MDLDYLHFLLISKLLQNPDPKLKKLTDVTRCTKKIDHALKPLPASRGSTVGVLPGASECFLAHSYSF